MNTKEMIPKTSSETESGGPLEDRILKLGALFFGEELLPYLGVREKVKRIAPTEQVHLEMKGFFEDFNFEMEDGSWRHLEFESDRITRTDLIRFRAYEAVTSHYYGVEVITIVICSAETKVLLKELRQGINIYRVKVFRLKSKDADKVFLRLEKRCREKNGCEWSPCFTRSQ